MDKLTMLFYYILSVILPSGYIDKHKTDYHHSSTAVANNNTTTANLANNLVDNISARNTNSDQQSPRTSSREGFVSQQTTATYRSGLGSVTNSSYAALAISSASHAAQTMLNAHASGFSGSSGLAGLASFVSNTEYSNVYSNKKNKLSKTISSSHNLFVASNSIAYSVQSRENIQHQPQSQSQLQPQHPLHITQILSVVTTASMSVTNAVNGSNELHWSNGMNGRNGINGVNAVNRHILGGNTLADYHRIALGILPEAVFVPVMLAPLPQPQPQLQSQPQLQLQRHLQPQAQRKSSIHHWYAENHHLENNHLPLEGEDSVDDNERSFQISEKTIVSLAVNDSALGMSQSNQPLYNPYKPVHPSKFFMNRIPGKMLLSELQDLDLREHISGRGQGHISGKSNVSVQSNNISEYGHYDYIAGQGNIAGQKYVTGEQGHITEGSGHIAGQKHGCKAMGGGNKVRHTASASKTEQLQELQQQRRQSQPQTGLQPQLELLHTQRQFQPHRQLHPQLHTQLHAAQLQLQRDEDSSLKMLDSISFANLSANPSAEYGGAEHAGGEQERVEEEEAEQKNIISFHTSHPITPLANAARADEEAILSFHSDYSSEDREKNKPFYKKTNPTAIPAGPQAVAGQRKESADSIIFMTQTPKARRDIADDDFIEF